MRFRRAVAGIRGPVAFWAMAGVGLFISHDAIFLVQVGPGEALASALRAAGHDYWGIASAVVGLVGLVTLAAALIRLRSLRRRADDLRAAPIVGRTRPYLARVLATWARLLVVVAAGFAIHENVEHLIGHAHIPGLGALLGPEYPLAMPVIALITAVGGLVAAAVGQAEHDLLAAIADARRRWFGPAPRRLVRPPLHVHPVAAPFLARSSAGRAPPALLVSPI